MADQRISQLATLAKSDLDVAADQLPIADVSTSETKKISPSALVQAAVTSLAAGSLPGTVVAANSLTALQLGPDSVGASELANNAVDTAAIQDLGVTSGKIADSAITTAKLADGSVTGAKLATASVGTAALAAGSVTADKVASDSITAAQLAPNAVGDSELADNAVDTASLKDQAVTTAKIADGAVTTVKLAVGAVTTVSIADGAVTTTDVADLAITAPKIADGAISASKLAAGGVGTAAIAPLAVTTGLIADGAVTSDKIGSPVAVGKLSDGASNTFLAGTGTGSPAYRQLIAKDLPLASSGTAGAVSVGAGLSVDVAGNISLALAGTAGTNPVVTYNQYGQVISGRSLVGADLPVATASVLGAVKVGTGLAVDSAGLVTTNLSAAQIPGLDTSKLISGFIDVARIKDGSVTRDKLADYTVSYIQEASPSTAAQHIGTLWLQESTGQLRMWNGNSWFPVGFGRLSAENLRYCGTFSAATGLITGVTQFGTQNGFVIGSAIPTAKDADTGAYFVCSTPGNGTGAAAGVSFDAGDWILCNGGTAGWVRIDTLNGGGGGGGASHLDDLLDVAVSAPTAGQILVYNTGGLWVNTSDVDGGTY